MDAAVAHFAALAPREIPVPEWTPAEAETLVLYARPLTLADQAYLMPYAEKNSLEFHALLLIRKCTNESGEPVFTKADKFHLMNRVDPEVLIRISQAIQFRGPEDEALGE